MNNAQLQGIRDTHEETRVGVLKKKALTAKEMAMIPHKLSKDSGMAITPTGEHYIWDSRFSHWARWK